MKLIELEQGMMNTLERFDVALLPLGLYSIDDLQDDQGITRRAQAWQSALSPQLTAQGYPTHDFYPRWPQAPCRRLAYRLSLYAMDLTPSSNRASAIS